MLLIQTVCYTCFILCIRTPTRFFIERSYHNLRVYFCVTQGMLCTRVDNGVLLELLICIIWCCLLTIRVTAGKMYRVHVYTCVRTYLVRIGICHVQVVMFGLRFPISTERCTIVVHVMVHARNTRVFTYSNHHDKDIDNTFCISYYINYKRILYTVTVLW